jgi:hypothetical protein
MKKLKCKYCKPALVGGLVLAIVHAVWALTIALIPQTFQAFLNWIFDIHFLVPIYQLTDFNLVKAILLTVITFICGYVVTWLGAVLWKKVRK